MEKRQSEYMCIQLKRVLANRVRMEALKRNVYFRDMLAQVVKEWFADRKRTTGLMAERKEGSK